MNLKPAEFWKQAAVRLQHGEELHVLRNLENGTSQIISKTTPFPKTESTGIALLENGSQCAQVLIPQPELILCGAGHIAIPVCQIAQMLEFSVTVLDDRKEFASAERFPGASTHCGNFAELLDSLPMDRSDWFVIVTRGHADDSVCLEHALKTPFAYIGMIGSKTKVQHTMEAMRAKGFSEELLSQVHAPIGLPIGGVTPAEIAVSIAAQLVEVRRQKQTGMWLGEDVLHSLLSGQAKAAVTVLSKKGSGPRGPGAMMCLNYDGSLSGTIGGGEAEHLVTLAASSLLPGETRLLTCTMDGKQAANTGMVCGGQVLLLLESLKERSHQ